mmetsp:Transcript_6464/g.13294  ORF Transcript_6464/g.13294 Transcript_6464/m.13294 type:complete len:207 (-) Transcript_6464:1043-1663(-)
MVANPQHLYGLRRSLLRSNDVVPLFSTVARSQLELVHHGTDTALHSLDAAHVLQVALIALLRLGIHLHLAEVRRMLVIQGQPRQRWHVLGRLHGVAPGPVVATAHRSTLFPRGLATQPGNAIFLAVCAGVRAVIARVLIRIHIASWGRPLPPIRPFPWLAPPRRGVGNSLSRSFLPRRPSTNPVSVTPIVVVAALRAGIIRRLASQ